MAHMKQPKVYHSLNESHTHKHTHIFLSDSPRLADRMWDENKTALALLKTAVIATKLTSMHSVSIDPYF